MKIYCNRREKTLEDFIGKDLWVRAYWYSPRNMNDYIIGYVKILSNRDRAILCSYIVDDVINAGDRYMSLKKSEFNRIYKHSLDLLKLLDPTDVFTDEEMKELLGI